MPAGDRRRVWKYRYRATDGRLRQLQLGEYPTMSWKRAGQEWQKHKVERDAPSGGDPVALIRAKDQAAKDRRLAEKAAAYTVEELCADYIRHVEMGGDKGRVGGLRRSREIERMLTFDVNSAFGRRQGRINSQSGCPRTDRPYPCSRSAHRGDGPTGLESCL